MQNPFFEQPILNSPYYYPTRHWELDKDGQPTQQVIANRRPAEFITPIPKPRKRKRAENQQSLIFDEGKGLSTAKQEYDPTPYINLVRQEVEKCRSLPNPNQWQVTPETARLLQHWRSQVFSRIRPATQFQQGFHFRFYLVAHWFRLFRKLPGDLLDSQQTSSSSTTKTGLTFLTGMP
jgi:type III restriction enzyme